MNPLLRTVLLIASIPVLPCRGDEAPAQPAEETIYLHCFRPTFGQKVIVDPEAPRDMTPATSPKALASLKVVVGEPFKFTAEKPHHGISGRIDRKDGKLVATLEGSFGSSSHGFSGPVEAEKAFDPEMKAFSSAVIPFRCVFSAKKEIEPFLKAQGELDAKKLEEATELTKRNIEIHKAKRESGKESAPGD